MEEDNKIRRNPLWTVISEEWKNLGNRKKNYLFYLFFFTIAGVITLMTPLVIGLIFNSIQQNLNSDEDLRKLIYMIFLLLAITAGFWFFHGIARALEQRTGFFVHRSYVNTKIKRVLELPTKWHKDHHSGDTIDKINRGSESLANFSQHNTSGIVYSILNIFGSLIILFFVDAYIALFALVFSSVTLYIIMKVDRKLITYYRQLNKYSNKVSAAIFDYISNINTVITLKLKKTVSQVVDKKILDAYPTYKKAANLSEVKWAFASIAISVMVVLVLSYKSYTDFKTTGVILIGTLYILYGYLENVGRTFFRFAELYGRIVQFDARISGAYPIDEAFEEVQDEVRRNLSPDWRRIDIRDLNFKYEESKRKRHLDNVSIKIIKGKKIALIGESGSGKSTILSVLRGLYPPKSGKVVYKGKTLDHGFSRLKHHITLIPQDPEIFNNTIGYNITMDLKASNEEVTKAIQIAQFENVVERLEKGLDTSVMERGVSLSGGEKQRLALARGILAARNSDIVLMDEPTSSVDSMNEIKIHEQVFAEFKGKTIISSIHRLHLLEKFDYIYMFDKGKIVEEGTLAKIKQNPKFREMWRKQVKKR
jgi:ABC-type multidrug transport system fused ATPase/permease subunit